VVTGAGSGIGRATAELFAGLGAAVVVADIDETAAKAVADSLGTQAFAYQVDVADPSEVDSLAETVASRHGVPDIVVNNAGIGLSGTTLDTTAEQWRRIVDINLLGVASGCRAFGSLMAQRKQGGHIVNVASAAAYMPSQMLPAYSATKAGVLQFSECFRAEMADHGVGVSAICPGFINTNITNTTTFAGVSAHEQKRLQAKASAAYRRRNYGPQKVAAHIVDAVRPNTALVPVAPEAHVGLWIARALPGLARRGAKLKPLS